MTIKLHRLEFGEVYRFGGTLDRTAILSSASSYVSDEVKHKASLVIVTKLPKREAKEVLEILGLLDGVA